MQQNYAIQQWRHAIAILKSDFQAEWREVLEVLEAFRLRRAHINIGGGRKSQVADALDTALEARGWQERCFATKIVIDDRSLDSPTHKVDCYKNTIGLEIEWNNKDPFFDRDLNNFRLLFELRALSVGIIVTRCDELQAIFDQLGGEPPMAVDDSLGQAAPPDRRWRRRKLPDPCVWDHEGVVC